MGPFRQWFKSCELAPFKWNLLGFVALRAWSLSMFPWAMGGIDLGNPLSDPWSVRTVASGAVALALALVAPRFGFARISRTATGAFFLAGSLGSLLLMQGLLANQSLPLLLGCALFGIELGYLETAWGVRFSVLRPKALQAYAFSLTAVASLLAIALMALPPSVYLPCTLLMIFASSALLVIDRLPEDDGSFDAAAGQSRTGKPGDAKYLFDILVSFAVFSVVFYFIRTANAVDSPTEGASVSGAAGSLGIACVLFILSALPKTLGLRRLKLAPPLMMVGFVLLLVLPNQYSGVGAFVAACGNKLIHILCWIIVLKSIAPLGLSAYWCSGLLMAIKMFASLAGVWAGTAVCGAMGEGVAAPATYIAIGCLILMVCVAWLAPEKAVEHLFAPPSLPPSLADNTARATPWDAACISERYKLTPRETEVAELLYMGLGTTAIMDRLVISKGTAHAHITHLYQKVGAHSRQELVDTMKMVLSDKSRPPESIDDVPRT